jgi:hypothetical protein
MDNDEEMIQKIIEVLTKAEADRKADREERKAEQEDFLARMKATFDDNRKKAEEDRKADRGLFGNKEE